MHQHHNLASFLCYLLFSNQRPSHSHQGVTGDPINIAIMLTTFPRCLLNEKTVAIYQNIGPIHGGNPKTIISPPSIIFPLAAFYLTLPHLLLHFKNTVNSYRSDANNIPPAVTKPATNHGISLASFLNLPPNHSPFRWENMLAAVTAPPTNI